MSLAARLARLGQVTDRIEETSIAVCLGAMTLITFANVVARYLFNDNILWALEATVYLFAWLVLMGASYGVKQQFHIGIDALTRRLPAPARKALALVAVACCVVFAVTLLIGAWRYWYPFASTRAFLETEDIPMPDALQFLAAWLNEGERYEKLPRFIPYLALPLGMALLTLRFLELAWRVVSGQADSIVASHEVDEGGGDTDCGRG